MATSKTSAAPKVKNTMSWKNAFKRDWQLYLLLAFPVLMVILFSYAAYPGLRMVFMDYKPAKGYSGSAWVGMETFIKIFKDKDFHRALRNSVVFNLLDLLLGFPMPVILALILNELRFQKFKKVSQTILYLPHFLSWAVIGSVAYTMFRPSTGLVNIALMNAGAISEGIPFLTEKWHWAVSYLLIGVWQTMGWGTIIYLAAITSVSPDLYEAARVDGAGRWMQCWHVTLPCIRSTIVTLLIMNLGKLMQGSFERIYALMNPKASEYTTMIPVLVYRWGIESGKFSDATALGLFQSIIGLILVLASDFIAKRLGEDGLI